MVKGLVSSVQSLGTLDGPGIRYVVFLQGCPLRCGCCHNPETWDLKGGKEYTVQEIVGNALKCKEYFGKTGGITLSGGEPLLQSEFVSEIFKIAKQNGINTCLDTSGCILDDNVKKLLDYTDYILLDIKYANDKKYQEYVGCSIQKPLEFLKYLQSINKKVHIRQVIIPTLNDSESDVMELCKVLKPFSSCIEKIEFLPFKKICQTKYDSMGKVFRFGNIAAMDVERVKELQSKINFHFN